MTQAAVLDELVDKDEEAVILNAVDAPGNSNAEKEVMQCNEPIPANITESIITDQPAPQMLSDSTMIASPYDIAPLPRALPRVEGRRKRKSESSAVLTSTPIKSICKVFVPRSPRLGLQMSPISLRSEAVLPRNWCSRNTHVKRTRHQPSHLHPLLWTILHAAFVESVSTNHPLTAGPSVRSVGRGIMTHVAPKTQLPAIAA